MKNQDVIKEFAQGVSKLIYGYSVRVSGYKYDKLYSYDTAIAQRLPNGKYVVNSTRYSVTTSKAQSYARYYIPSEKQVHTDINVPFGADDLTKFVSDKSLLK